MGTESRVKKEVIVVDITSSVTIKVLQIEEMIRVNPRVWLGLVGG